jgi:hypothetical protein
MPLDAVVQARARNPAAPELAASLLFGDILDVGVDPPVVAEQIDDAGAPIAVERVLWLAKRRRSRLERPLIHLVDVLDVRDDGRRHRPADSLGGRGVGEHDELHQTGAPSTSR